MCMKWEKKGTSHRVVCCSKCDTKPSYEFHRPHEMQREREKIRVDDYGKSFFSFARWYPKQLWFYFVAILAFAVFVFVYICIIYIFEPNFWITFASIHNFSNNKSVGIAWCECVKRKFGPTPDRASIVWYLIQPSPIGTDARKTIIQAQWILDWNIILEIRMENHTKKHKTQNVSFVFEIPQTPRGKKRSISWLL